MINRIDLGNFRSFGGFGSSGSNCRSRSCSGSFRAPPLPAQDPAGGPRTSRAIAATACFPSDDLAFVRLCEETQIGFPILFADLLVVLSELVLEQSYIAAEGTAAETMRNEDERSDEGYDLAFRRGNGKPGRLSSLTHQPLIPHRYGRSPCRNKPVHIEKRASDKSDRNGEHPGARP